MSNYENLYEAAAGNCGLITHEDAAKIGVSDKELSRLTSEGRLTRIGHGVYRIKHHLPGDLDPYAESVAIVDPGAYLYGESVLAMFSLCPTNPARMYVGTPRRVRRNLPAGMKVVQRKDTTDVTEYEGIPSQSVEAAIRSCKGRIVPERLRAAVQEARRQELLSKDEADRLDREVALRCRRKRTAVGISTSRSSALRDAGPFSSRRVRYLLFYKLLI